MKNSQIPLNNKNMSKKQLLLPILILTVLNLFATNYTSVTDGPWNDPNTWSPMGIPNVTNTAAWPGDNVTISHAVTFTGNLKTAKQASIIISASGNFTVTGDLQIANSNPSSFNLLSGGVLNPGNLNITTCCSTVTLNGTVNTNNFTFTASTPISIGGDVTVNGDFNTNGGSPINFTGGQFTVLGNSNIQGSVKLNIDGGTVTNFGNLSLTGDGDISGVGIGGSIGFTTLSMANSSTTITCVSGCNYNGTTSAPPNPLDLMTGMAILPVSLIDFSAKLVKNEVSINWSTALETNNDFFVLEYSTDGQTFKELAVIQGKGNEASEATYYNWTHGQAVNGNNYYRLWQYDFDGSNALLGLRKVNMNRTGKLSTTISPNPSVRGQFVNIQLTNANPEETTVQLISVTGQSWAFDIQPNNTIQIPSHFTPGMYFLQVNHEGDTVNSSLVIQ